MAFRNDHNATLTRLAAVERELSRVKARNAALEARLSAAHDGSEIATTDRDSAQVAPPSSTDAEQPVPGSRVGLSILASMVFVVFLSTLALPGTKLLFLVGLFAICAFAMGVARRSHDS